MSRALSDAIDAIEAACSRFTSAPTTVQQPEPPRPQVPELTVAPLASSAPAFVRLPEPQRPQVSETIAASPAPTLAQDELAEVEPIEAPSASIPQPNIEPPREFGVQGQVEGARAAPILRSPEPIGPSDDQARTSSLDPVEPTIPEASVEVRDVETATGVPAVRRLPLWQRVKAFFGIGAPDSD